MNTTEKDPVRFSQQSQAVCLTYAQSIEGYQQGKHTISVDEMTGIQALERAAPTKPARPGFVERREFEYIRHGTQTLIANFEVGSGQVICPSLGDSRTEVDFVAHIAQTVATDPDADWTFVLDQLNIHQSEGLVIWVAQHAQLTDPLGQKGKTGILATIASRAAFLAEPTHRIRFVYTPKHSSWLNQIELWFSILMRRLLKRASFVSIADLNQRILDFIAFFNRTAKPFKWTYKGRPLQL
jgi:transposase